MSWFVSLRCSNSRTSTRIEIKRYSCQSRVLLLTARMFFVVIQYFIFYIFVLTHKRTNSSYRCHRWRRGEMIFYNKYRSFCEWIILLYRWRGLRVWETRRKLGLIFWNSKSTQFTGPFLISFFKICTSCQANKSINIRFLNKLQV